MPKQGYLGSSDAAALFNKSPYATYFQLWARVAKGIQEENIDDDERVQWGVKLEPLILQATADRMKWDIEPNEGTKFVAHPDPKLRSGSTVDGWIVKHERGRGVCEAKNVDLMRWLQTWTEEAAPEHIELQLQKQLFDTGCSWGVIACLVGGNDLKIYEREAMPEVQEAFKRELIEFWRLVESGEEPDPLGIEKEVPTILDLYPTADPEETLELFGEENRGTMEIISNMEYWGKKAKEASKIVDECRAKILAMGKNAGKIRTNGFEVKLSKWTTYRKPGVTEDLELALDDLISTDRIPEDLEDLAVAWFDWQEKERAGSPSCRLTIKPIEGDPELKDELLEGLQKSDIGG